MRHLVTSAGLYPLIAYALLSRPTMVAAAAPPTPDCISCSGKRVRVERFAPAGAARLPAIILLHGLDGIDAGGGLYRALAARLVARGYVAVLVHYFDRTGTKKENLLTLLEQFRAYLDDTRGGEKHRQILETTFASWLEAAEAAVADARSHPRIDADRIALVGVSAGGFLATAAAARQGTRVRCVAALFGGLPRALADRAGDMPPALLVHGGADEVVPLREAHSLRDLLKRRRRECEVKVYAGVGHGFLKKGRPDWLAALDAERRTLSFLDRHLGPRRAKQSAPPRGAEAAVPAG